jgi:hypothetical protein
MAERGFRILNPELRHIQPGTRAQYATFGSGVAEQAVFFCKEEIFGDLKALVRNESAWQEPLETQYDIHLG